MIIYHNPRCRKSRETLQLIKDKGITVEIVEYLNTSLSEFQLKDILSKLGMKAIEIVRKGEPVFKENFKGKDFSEDQWIRILAENPILIERPIVVKENEAVIGRPPENVLKLL